MLFNLMGASLQYSILHRPNINLMLCVPYLRGDCGVSHALSSLQRSFTSLHLEFNVTASFKQLFRDGRMPFVGRDVQGRGPILPLKIHVAASLNQLFCDGRKPISGRDVERRGPIFILVVQRRLRICHRQQQLNGPLNPLVVTIPLSSQNYFFTIQE